MPEPNFAINFTAEMIATSVCDVGELLVYNSSLGYWLVATAAARAAAGSRSQAVALTDYGGSAVGKVAYQSSGVVAAAISGLATTGSRSLVRCSATGTIERIATGSADPDTDDLIGYAEADGRVHLCFGFPFAELITLAGGGGGGATPGGVSGSVQSNDGAGGFAGYSNVLTGSGYIQIGTTTVGAGGIRLNNGNAYAINARDAGNTATVNLIHLSASDVVTIGYLGYNVTIHAGVARTITSIADFFSFVDSTAVEQVRISADIGDLGTTFKHPIWLYDSNQSHTYRFVPGNITANRDMTIPALTGNDVFVFAAHGQTLTNKTVNSTDNTITSTSQAAGDVLVNNGTKYVRLAKGSDGTFLGVSSGTVGYYTPASGGAGSSGRLAIDAGTVDGGGDCDATTSRSYNSILITGTATGTRTLVLQAPANEGETYVITIENRCSEQMTVDIDGGGSTWDLDSAGYETTLQHLGEESGSEGYEFFVHTLTFVVSPEGVSPSPGISYLST
jgi:hypothetical protein